MTLVRRVTCLDLTMDNLDTDPDLLWVPAQYRWMEELQRRRDYDIAGWRLAQ